VKAERRRRDNQIAVKEVDRSLNHIVALEIRDILSLGGTNRPGSLVLYTGRVSRSGFTHFTHKPCGFFRSI
jgi:hypothetical protein